MASWESGSTTHADPGFLVPRPRPASDPLRGAEASPWWLDVMDATIRTCKAHGRVESAEWLTRRRARLLHPELRVLVLGAADQGKSQLINAMINAPACGAGQQAGSAVPTVVRHAATPAAHLIRRGSPASDWTATVGLQDRIQLAPDRLGASLLEAAAKLPSGTPLHAEIGVPRSLLASGLVLIDAPAMPGLGGPRAPGHGADAATAAQDLAYNASADLVLFVCEAGRRLGGAELDVLAGLSRVYPGLLVVFTKTDYTVDWRKDLAESRTQLARAGIPAAVTAVSAALRMHAVRTGDEALNRESGFPDLLAHLLRMVADKPEGLARATAGALTRITVEELVGPLRDELTGQENAGTSDAVARVHVTQRRLDDLRRCAVRWQNSLSDEAADLMSDIEHDLRERVKAVLAGSDEFFTTADPAKAWDEFEPWLRDSLQELALTSMTWLAERTEWMARRTADQFPADAGDVLPLPALTAAGEVTGGVSALDAPPVARFTPGQKLFIGLRGSYGGVVMFGFATSLAGMSLINPISIGGGALFGSKSVRDESKALLKRRQAEARTAAQRHVDDVFVKLNKDARDTVRRVQRALRDHFTAVTEDLQEEAMELLRNAKAAADQDAAARDQRLQRIRQALAQLADLHEQARTLGGRTGL